MLKKLYHYFKFLFNKKSNTEIINISIFLRPNYEIDIQLAYPDWSKLEDKNIPAIAEKYAELLVYINKGLFKNEINDILSKTPALENENSVLFIQNVKNFYEMHNSEISKILKNNRPLISPSSVFRI